MLTEVTRRRIAREFINKNFNQNLKLHFELWKNHDDLDKNKQIMSFCPIPSVFIHSASTDPVIIVHDDKDELFEFLKTKYSERFDYFEFNEYNGYFVAYD